MSILWRMVRAVVRGHTSWELRVGDYPLLALEPVQPVPSLADFYVPVRQDARTESGQGPKPTCLADLCSKIVGRHGFP